MESDKGELCIDTTRNKFGSVSATADYRLYIHISDFTTEAIYFGFGESKHNTGSSTFRLYRPDGTIDTSGLVPVTSGNRGYIDNWSQAVAGPTVVGGPSGYWALRCTPNMNGDYYIAFKIAWQGGFGQEQYKTFANFDVTVVNIPTWSAKDGRLWSKAWQLYAENPQFASNNQYWGKMFIYSMDSIVTKVDLNGMIPGTFTVSCNRSGCYPIDVLHPLTEARKSVSGEHTYPQYKIFLNNPDSTIYPSGTLGGLDNTVPVTALRHCNGAVDFTFGTTKAGNVEIHLLLGALGPPYVDRVLPAQVVTGLNTISWDGIDGAGNPILNGAVFQFYISYVNGLTHLPLYDVEFNENGFRLALVRPITVPAPPDPLFYWDDSNLGGGTTNLNGCLSSPTTGCHIWNTTGNGGFGNNRTINTWWYAVSTSTASLQIFQKREPGPLGAITGPTSLCPGTNIVNYSVSTEPNSTSYQWAYSGAGATIINNGNNFITINFSVSATSGTLSVRGYNDSCGLSGTPSNLVITMLPFPPVVLNVFTPVCIDLPAFPLSGGSPAGGTYSIAGIPATIFDPAIQGIGTHIISYFYSDPFTSCSKSVDQPLLVNPLPVVSLNPISSVCANAPAFSLSGGNPAGGIYSGTGVTAGIFNPSVAGPGTWNIIYTYTDANSCTNSNTKPVTVFAVPVVTLAPLAPVCVNINPFTLTGGTPAGGVYSGPGVTAGIFDPSAAGPGIHSILYTYTDVNGCISNDTKNLTVNPLPGSAGTITGVAVICQGSNNVVYTTTAIANATSYAWSVLPALAGTISGSSTSVSINWSTVFSGTANVYVKGVNACGDGLQSNAFPVTINPKPVVTFKICTDSVTTTDAKPIVLKGGIPPGGTYSGPGVNSGTGIFTPVIAGAGSHTIRYTYNNFYGCSSFVNKTFIVVNPALFACGGNLRDVRDNKIYKTVSIGTQCWMAENLNYGTSILTSLTQRDNCVPEKYCYGDTPANCIASGGLYQWDEIMDYYVMPEKQGLCPPGWHLPSENEWTILFNNYINNGFAASALKATGFSGFNALVPGVEHSNNIFSYSNFASLLWSSDLHGPYKAWAHGMNTFDPSVSRYPSNRNHSFSVRCIKN